MTIILVILGILFMTAGKLYKNYKETAEKYTEETLGTVIEVIPDEPDEGGKAQGIHDYYYPVFAYYAGGQLYKERFFQGSNPPEFQVNQEVKLCYNKRNPSQYIIAQKTAADYVPTMLYVGGFICCMLAIVNYMAFASGVLA